MTSTSSPAPAVSTSPPHATPAISRSQLVAGLAIAIGGAVLFSTKAIVAKLLYRYQLDAVAVLCFRMLFSLPVFGAIALWQSRGGLHLTRREWWHVIGIGIVGYYLSSFFDFLGLQYISVGLERLILFLTPTFVLLMTAFILKRRISRIEWLAMAVSYAGIVLVFVHDLKGGAGSAVIGSLLVLGSAVCYAIYLLSSGELVKRLGSLRLVSYVMCVSAVACIGQFFLLRPASMLIQPMPVYGLSLVNAVFCTILPVFMTMAAVQRIGAPSASQAGMIGPVSTLFLGFAILGEPITGVQIAGTVLVMVGIYMLSLKK